MKIKQTVALVGMGFAFSGVAQATTYVTLTPGFIVNNPSVQTYDVTPGSPGPSSLLADHLYSGSVSVIGQFQHKWSFDIGSHLWTGGSVMNVSILPAINIQNLSVALFNKNDAMIPGITCSGGFCSGSGLFTPDVNYYFLVQGQGNGTLAPGGFGQYTFSMTTAVPEAETWAMMLAGLGLVGLQLRRKSKVAKKIAVH